MVTTCSTQIIYSIIFLSNVALLHSTLASTYRAGDVGIEQQNHQIFGNENQLFECHMHKHIIFCPPARQKIIHYNLPLGEKIFDGKKVRFSLENLVLVYIFYPPPFHLTLQ